MKKYVLVTGATGGIGSALVRAAVASGALDGVFGVCRNLPKWEKLFGGRQGESAENGQAFCGAAVLPLPCLPAALQEKLSACLGRFQTAVGGGTIPAQGRSDGPDGEMTVVMTAFTIEPLAHVMALDPGDVTDNFQANVAQPVAQLQAILAVCRTYGVACRVVYLGSGASSRPIAGWGLYGASKSYMNLLLKTLALEENIPVVWVDPGVVDTGMQAAIRRTPEEVCGQVGAFREYHEKGLLRSPQSVAGCLLERYVLTWQAQVFEEKAVFEDTGGSL